MAHEGHVIIKKSGLDGRKINPARFFRPIDKGSNKPAFCYPRHRDALKEEVDSMQRKLDGGYVDSERRMVFEYQLDKKKKRLSEIQDSFDNRDSIINENKDDWVKYRQALAEEIAGRTPTKQDERQGRINPHRRLKDEKYGIDGKPSLDGLKRQYQIVSKALDMESNTGFLQREK